MNNEYQGFDGLEKLVTESGCVYRPIHASSEPLVCDAKIGVKFANRTFLMKSYLDQQGIEYKLDELEDSVFGLGIYIDEPDKQKGPRKKEAD